ncbi:hypothetical protein WR25_26148 [Diploscapter pachys]|uniref:Uncharacterized protein n=1 Tax=Diploscapter pachys TaxID=2018661 RepID=A0A2A2J675_9BILA|nr:hypothetical protein WR25_26148 [Diploscapter pachys]
MMLHKSTNTTQEPGPSSMDIGPSGSRTNKPRKRAEPQMSSPIIAITSRRKRSAESADLTKITGKRKSSACGLVKKKGWRESGRKLSEALPAALRNPSNILRRSSAQQQQQAKKPLGPSLSWDPEHRSRSPSGSSRSRVHSDGSNDPSNSETPDNDKCGIEEPRFELEITCPHCLLVAEYRKSLLKSQLENAVIRLARRLGSQQASHRDDGLRGPFGTPDIVVSSISSDDEEGGSMERYNTGSEKGSSLQTSEARHVIINYCQFFYRKYTI